ncbi:FtsX-like permease family protein [Kocuria sp. HSID16901]|uniref:FtsX-like permease family protein n=1 Tax=Kocuria sp. HSID16901 TaxID=2419505 RepID=UPI00066113EF|nr:FtsX-like permease family protein [Kocuria sp. HSID16901]MCT1367712.1 ABC transporter permease [Rothia sp. p3-SID1597]
MNRLFLRKTFDDRGTWALPVGAFMATSAIWFTVLGGAHHLMTMPDTYGLGYGFFAALALILLLVPMAALMSSAGRLMARQRDRRLSTLRLLGASRRKIRGIALTEAAVFSGTGVFLGLIAYLLLCPLVGLIHFGGRAIGAGGMWMGFPLLILGILVLMGLALGSALMGLSRIHVSPLGVRARTVPRSVRWMRLMIGVGLFLLAQIIFGALSGGIGGAFLLVGLLLVISVPLVGVHFLGPLVLKWVASSQAKRAPTAVKLMAARNVLESPQEMWRQVGGIAFSVYLAVVAGSGVALLNMGDTGNVPAEEVIFMRDLQTGVIVALTISFVMVAASVCINQTAQVLDRKELYLGLSRIGMPVEDLSQIRQVSVMRSLWAVVLISIGTAGVTMAPIIGAAILINPLTMLTILVTLGLGVVVVRVATSATKPTLRRVAQA